MTNFVPIFPLGIVVYPGETVNLHVFEPRYRQLIEECYAADKPFGIPTVLNNGVGEMGTLVQMTELVKRYEDGKMDIRVTGVRVFRILELVKSIPDKLYSGAIVTYPENDTEQHEMVREVVTAIRQLHRILEIRKEFARKDEVLISYDIAHHAGLSLEEEYEILGLLHEIQRLEYIRRFLNKVLPVVSSMEELKKKVRFNGHFRELEGFKFDF